MESKLHQWLYMWAELVRENIGLLCQRADKGRPQLQRHVERVLVTLDEDVLEYQP